MRNESSPGAGDAPIDEALSEIEAFSGDDYRLALVATTMVGENWETLSDIVHVRETLAQNNRGAFRDSLRDMEILDGLSITESTDECLNTVVNQRSVQNAPAGKQFGEFDPWFDSTRNGQPVKKVIVLITDIEPGGFAGQFNQDVWCNARKYALDARDKDIKIVALQIGAGSFEKSFSFLCPDSRDNGGDEDNVNLGVVMKYYADTSCGRQIVFSSVEGDGLAEGISGALVYDEYPTCPESL